MEKVKFTDLFIAFKKGNYLKERSDWSLFL